MENKHTPGPWVVGPSIEDDGFVEIPIGVPTKAGYFTVAVAMGGMNPEFQIGNARLMAAAPELLEALVSMVNARCDGMNIQPINYAYAKAYAAISKAVGAQQ